MDCLAYVHDLSPIIVSVNENIAVRWYGLAYVLGFLLGFLVLRSLSRKGLWNLPVGKVPDFITYVAIFGIMVGARLGYVFFYAVRKPHGWSDLWHDPLSIFRVWEGGMASHGGLIGVIVFTVIYAYRNKLSTLGLLDGLAIVAPIGLFFGRVANFINGELYGRVTEGVSWAMKFPMELWENSKLAQAILLRLHVQNSALVADYPVNAGSREVSMLILENQQGNPEVKTVLEQFLPDRHPSQLYEAFAEGALIFLVLYIVRIKFPSAPNGLFSGLFCLLYAGGRITVEYFREPDSALVGPFTMGQFLSLFMVIAGVGLLAYAWKSRGKNIPVAKN